MLKIQAKPLDVEYGITHEYDGKKVLEFEISADHLLYSILRHELKIDEQSNYYIVKSIQELNGSAQIKCDLDMDSLKSTMFKTFTTETLSLSETLSKALTGTGWTVVDAELIAIRRSMDLENVTPYDIVFATEKTFDCVYKINTKTKTLTVVKPQNIQWQGAYITDQVNLQRVDYKGDTYEFCTRLYPYGVKDEAGNNLTIASVNGGKTYIDNFDYTDKIIVGAWTDERYTVAQNLKDDAIEMLKTLSRPAESYLLDVVDIAKISDRHEALQLGMYDIVMLLDRRRNRKVQHRIVEMVENPMHPEKNQVTLSMVIQKIETQIIGKIDTIAADNLITKEKVNEIKRDVDTNTARIAETYTKGETDAEIASQITQATDGIRLEASKTYATKTEVEQIELTPGAQGPKGDKGDNSYFHIKYSPVASPTAAQMTETPSTYIGTYVDYTATDSTDPSKYTWARFQGLQGPQGTQGIPGTNGASGQTSYLHIKYSDDGGKTLTANTGETPGDYIGQYTDFVTADSTDPTKYTWSKIKGATGPQGPQGVQGPKGADGKQYYTWLKYADTPTSGMSDDPTGKKYMGLAYNKTTAAESSDYADYTWSLIKGEKGDQGVQGPAGANGQPTYTWIKYGTSALGANMSDDPAGKTYIGLAYNKMTAAESNNASDYTWSLIKGADGVSVNSVTVEYYLSTSATAQTGGSWSTTVPTWEDGKYIWSRTKTTLSDGNTTTTTPVCITGGKGGTGAAGKGVKSIVTQFYLSTSKTSQTGGSWGTTMPTWSPGKYVWTRSLITYTDNTTTTTTPQCDSGWEAVNGIQVGGRNLIQRSAISSGAYYKTFEGTLSGFGVELQTSTSLRVFQSADIFDRFVLGETYTVSFRAVADGETKLNFDFYPDTFNGVFSNPQVTVTTDEQLYTLSGTLTNTGTPNVMYIRFWRATNSPNYKISVYDIKVEKGNKATDWTPAPEDVDQNINDAVNGIQIGGRNLLLGTSVPAQSGITDAYVATTVNQRYNYSPIIADDPKAFLLSVKDGYLLFSYDVDVPAIYKDSNQTLNRVGAYFTFKITNKTTDDATIWYGTHSTQGVATQKHHYVSTNSLRGVSSQSADSPDSFVGHYSCYLKMSEVPALKAFYANPDDYKVTGPGADVNIRGMSKGGCIKNLQLTTGKYEMDWVPAPEDTDEAINDAMITVIDRTNAAIDIANDNILNTVSHEYSKKSDLEEVRQYTDTKVQQTADSITYTFTTVQEAIDLLDGKVDQNKLDMEEYIRFAGAMIELGKRGSPFVAKLDNTKLAFLQDGREIAYISNNTLYITDAIIKGRLTMTMVGGFFDWVPEQNGSMSLVWREA